MNLQVIISLSLAVLWLGSGIYIVIAFPRTREPFGGDSRITMGWFAFGLMILWNLVRAAVYWKPKAPSERRHVLDE